MITNRVMLGIGFILFTLPILALCSGEGNIHLLEEEIADALKSCSQMHKNKDPQNRQKRSESFNKKIDRNPYDHVRRNNSFLNQIHILNNSDVDYLGSYRGEYGERLINSIPRPALGTDGVYKRNKRNEPLLSKDDNDQCLSQCVFANLQVVDSQGIPREAEVWDKVQTSVASQQSRVLLKDQIRACFQELQSESEDNGCSYSNKLERCLMLRLSDRKIKNGTQDNLST